jgi:hypothetical protein
LGEEGLDIAVRMGINEDEPSNWEERSYRLLPRDSVDSIVKVLLASSLLGEEARSLMSAMTSLGKRTWMQPSEWNSLTMRKELTSNTDDVFQQRCRDTFLKFEIEWERKRHVDGLTD